MHHYFQTLVQTTFPIQKAFYLLSNKPYQQLLILQNKWADQLNIMFQLLAQKTISFQMRKSQFRGKIILLFIIYTFIVILNQKDILFKNMDLKIDFTDEKHHRVTDLAQYPYIRSITFILPFFEQMKTNFSCLWEYITFLNDKPLVKIFVKPKSQEMKPKYKTVAVGGTFDHLHIGHQMLLLHAALQTQKTLIIGITSEQMLQKKNNKEIIQSLLMRINEVREFIKTFREDIQLRFVQLQDPWGPTTTQEDIDAIVVSPETLKSGQTINSMRKQKGFHPLEIENCPIMAPVHHLTSLKEIQNKISSTQLRAHILAKNGLTLEKYIQYHKIWIEMINKINKLSGCDQKQNHLVNGKWWDIVVKYYSQYWRFYHTNHHLATIFRQLSETPEFGYQKLSETDKIILQVSIFFHDIIYRPDLNSNEEESAHFASSFLNQVWSTENNLNVKKQLIQKVKSAILTTKAHKGNSEVQKILCELDMSILDSPLEKYKTYAFNVQRQYRPLVKEDYPKKRVEFLNKLHGTYKYTWRKGQNINSNIEWQISHWTSQKQ